METNVVDERIRFAADFVSGQWSMTELCERYGVTRPTGYKWVARHRVGGERPGGPQPGAASLSAPNGTTREAAKRNGARNMWPTMSVTLARTTTKPRRMVAYTDWTTSSVLPAWDHARICRTSTKASNRRGVGALCGKSWRLLIETVA
jgi:transposase-like protein